MDQKETVQIFFIFRAGPQVHVANSPKADQNRGMQTILFFLKGAKQRLRGPVPRLVHPAAGSPKPMPLDPGCSDSDLVQILGFRAMKVGLGLISLVDLLGGVFPPPQT